MHNNREFSFELGSSTGSSIDVVGCKLLAPMGLSFKHPRSPLYGRTPVSSNQNLQVWIEYVYIGI